MQNTLFFLIVFGGRFQKTAPFGKTRAAVPRAANGTNAPLFDTTVAGGGAVPRALAVFGADADADVGDPTDGPASSAVFLSPEYLAQALFADAVHDQVAFAAADAADAAGDRPAAQTLPHVLGVELLQGGRWPAGHAATSGKAGGAKGEPPLLAATASLTPQGAAPGGVRLLVVKVVAYGVRAPVAGAGGGAGRRRAKSKSKSTDTEYVRVAVDLPMGYATAAGPSSFALAVGGAGADAGPAESAAAWGLRGGGGGRTAKAATDAASAPSVGVLAALRHGAWDDAAAVAAAAKAAKKAAAKKAAAQKQHDASPGDGDEKAAAAAAAAEAGRLAEAEAARAAGRAVSRRLLPGAPGKKTVELVVPGWSVSVAAIFVRPTR